MLNYLKQVEICESVQKIVKKSISSSDDKNLKMQNINFPTTESILRAVSVLPNIDTEEKLKDFIIEHISRVLRLAPVQKAELMNFSDPSACS